jgi:hypothetical protein
MTPLEPLHLPLFMYLKNMTMSKFVSQSDIVLGEIGERK